MIGLDASYLKF